MGSVVINEAAIQAKVRAWGNSGAGQAKISAVIKDLINGIIHTGVTITGDVLTVAEMMEAAEKMKSILAQCSSGLPASVQSIVANASIGPISENGPGSYSVSLQFHGDFVRPSLQPTKYGYVNNIVALFNNGYRAGGQVFGDWHGNRIGSLQERAGTHFVNEAVAVFNSTCGGQYHATASASGEYV